MIRFAARFRHLAECPAELWSFDSLEVLTLSEELWVRASAEGDDGQGLLRQLKVLDADCFVVTSDGRLVPEDGRVPVGCLPDGNWMSVRRWLQTVLPDGDRLIKEGAGDGDTGVEPLPLKLIPSTEEQPPKLLMADLKEFLSWALHSARFRLERLRFAASGDAKVLIEGEPLPAIPGRYYFVQDRVAVPCGFVWTPGVEANVVMSVLSRSLKVGSEVADQSDEERRHVLQREDHPVYYVWDETGVGAVYSEDFVACRRAALRETLDALAAEGGD